MAGGEANRLLSVAWFGTSIMHQRGYVQRVRLSLQARWPMLRFGWDNRAAGGSTSRDVLQAVRRGAAGGDRWDLAFIGCGINDVWRRFQGRAGDGVSIGEFAENFRAAVRLLRQSATKVVCIGETPFGWDKELDVAAMNAELSGYIAVAERIARAEHAGFIDPWPTFVATVRDLSGSPWSDGVHLSELGDALMLRLVEQHLDDHAVIPSLTADLAP